MKQVIEQYGRFMLNCMVFLTLMTIVFYSVTDQVGNKGIYAIIGANIETKSIDYHTYMDFEQGYQAECGKPAPEIYVEVGRLSTGLHTLSNYIKARDYAGELITVKISSIKAPDGTECFPFYNQDTTEIYMSQSGIYTIMVSATDTANKVTKAIIRIPMNSC